MQLVKKVIVIVLLLFFIQISSYADNQLVVKEGAVDVQPLGKAVAVYKESIQLEVHDKVEVPSGALVDLHMSSGVGGVIGEESIFLIDEKDSTQWDKLILVKGSGKFFGSSAPVFVKTPVSNCFVFNGACIIMVDQGVTLVCPIEEQGVMLTTKGVVLGIEPGYLGIIGKDGSVSEIKQELPPLDYVEKDQIEYSMLSKKYRDDVFAYFKILIKPDDSLSRRAAELRRYTVNFNSPLDALEKISEIYYYYSRKHSLLMEGKELLFYQLLSNSRDFDTIIPNEVVKLFEKNKENQLLFNKLKVAEKELARFSSRQRYLVIRLFRKQAIQNLLPRLKIKENLSYSIREVLAYNSNVTQTPDGQQVVSDTDDFSATTILGMTYTDRKRNFGEASIKLGYTDIAYFKDEFTNREFTSVSITLKDKLKLSDSKIFSAVTPQVSYSKNYLNTDLGRYNAFDVSTPQFQFVFKRINKPWRFSDYIIFIKTIGVEFKDYLGVGEIDNRGYNKDVVAPFITLMGINLKRFDSFMLRSSLLINGKKFDSSSNELDYKSLRITLTNSFVLPRITCDVIYGYSSRSQPIYLGVGKRSDRTHSLSLGGKIRVLQNRGTFGAIYKRAIQNSNLNLFEYDSNQSSIYFSYRF